MRLNTSIIQEKPNILIVEDEKGPRESLKMILKDLYSLSFAENGEKAIKYIENYEADLVIMDLKMPIMDGLTALRFIKKINPYISVLIVTGYGTIDSAVEAMKLGAYDYISKPFNSKEIIKLVKKGIEEKRKALVVKDIIDSLQLKSNRLQEKQNILQRELLELSKLSSIGILAQGIAHNLSSPLLIILGRAELMKEKLTHLRKKISNHSIHLYNEDAKKFMDEYDAALKDTEIIVENVNRLTEITRKLLIKSSKDQKKNIQMLNLSEILKEELDFLESNLYFKHHIIKNYNLAPNLPLIRGVYSDFSQSFSNLINNSIDAMKNTPNKILSIKTYYDEKFVFVEIKDTGCGIPEEIKDKIFNPYFSTKRSIKNKYFSPGLGLGLYMVKLMLRPYKAEITFKSKKGDTTFVIKIPYITNYT